MAAQNQFDTGIAQGLEDLLLGWVWGSVIFLTQLQGHHHSINLVFESLDVFYHLRQVYQVNQIRLVFWHGHAVGTVGIGQNPYLNPILLDNARGIVIFLALKTPYIRHLRLFEVSNRG